MLARVSLPHAQFETIHPFSDGNGRTGRAIVHAMLRRSGVTHTLTVPGSAGLLTETAADVTAALDAFAERVGRRAPAGPRDEGPKGSKSAAYSEVEDPFRQPGSKSVVYPGSHGQPSGTFRAHRSKRPDHPAASDTIRARCRADLTCRSRHRARARSAASRQSSSLRAVAREVSAWLAVLLERLAGTPVDTRTSQTVPRRLERFGGCSMTYQRRPLMNPWQSDVHLIPRGFRAGAMVDHSDGSTGLLRASDPSPQAPTVRVVGSGVHLKPCRYLMHAHAARPDQVRRATPNRERGRGPWPGVRWA